MARRVLISGGTGFLGRHATQAFDAAGWEVFRLGSSDGDLRDPGHVSYVVSKYAPDTVVHLAAACGGIGANQKKPFDYWHDNTLMGAHVLAACARLRVRLVLVGTVCSYAALAKTPFKEADFWNGFPELTNAPYGIAKKSLLAGMDAARSQYGLRGVYLIPANLYGPGDHFEPETSHVIPAIIRNVVGAQECGHDAVSLWGTGTATRDFLYAPDCAQALVKAAEKENIEGPINLGTGREVSILDLAHEIARLCGWGGEFCWNHSKPDGQPRRVLDSKRAWEELHWHAETTLESGLIETIEWYRANRSRREEGW